MNDLVKDLVWIKCYFFIGLYENVVVVDFNNDGYVDIVSGLNIFFGLDFVM